ncbi:hypothetical protein ACFQZ2_00775 [Streptomonospora algeriensis]|uniref:Uncharacterized protein n=1 Tax=Streptomonospora algeriensis TaxID=995084 RepID=A0ABW3B9N7_9ACTN
MATVNLTAVDHTLAFSSSDIPSEHVEAFDYTLAWAQAVARTYNPDPSSQVYFDTMKTELSRVGWNVLDAGSDTIDIVQDRIEPKSIIFSMLSPYLRAEQQSQLNGVLEAMRQPNAGVHDFLTFWWNKASVHQGKTEMMIGPLYDYLNQPSTVLLHYSFNFEADDWRSLFVERATAELTVSAYHLTMNESIPQWHQIRDALEKKFGDKANAHIDNTKIDI